tara:strand:- start:3260 stop:4237 length:978 start_codon:yes stop_codon:yes gene_type:complete
MGKNEEILNIVKLKGPILPVQVSKQINDNILMTSARLSEILSNKQIKVSYLKVGGSPLYYAEGQEIKLQDYSDNLAEKEKEAYELLKQNKILGDITQEPGIRVALRQIKDFAVPLKVNYENKAEIFWKWYLTDKDETQELIKGLLSKKETKEEVKQETEIKQENQTTKKEPEPIKQEVIEEKQKEKTTEPIKTKETQKVFEEQKQEPKEQKPEIKKERKKIDKEAFLREINRFFDRNRINVKETNEIKKNSEIDFVAELQTTIGNVKYFCKSKNKKRISDGDLSSAFMQAQSKGLPLLFLSKGELTKKAKEIMEADKNNITFKKV